MKFDFQYDTSQFRPLELLSLTEQVDFSSMQAEELIERGKLVKKNTIRRFFLFLFSSIVPIIPLVMVNMLDEPDINTALFVVIILCALASLVCFLYAAVLILKYTVSCRVIKELKKQSGNNLL